MDEMPDGVADEGWKPGQDVTQLNGEAMDPRLDFFAAPPAELGEVVAAGSTLRLGKRAWPFFIRYTLPLLCPVLMAWGAYKLICVPGDPLRLQVSSAVLGGTLGLGAGALIYFLARFKHACGYVSDRGAARIVCLGDRGRPRKPEVLVFDEATELLARSTQNYFHGAYAGTTYDYRWLADDKRVVFRLKGQHFDKSGRPSPTHLYYLATAAEAAWSRHLLDRLQPQFDREGSVSFRVNRRGVLHVGPTWLEFRKWGRVHRLSFDDIASIVVAVGKLVITSKNAKWYRGGDSFRLDYQRLANAQAFLICVNRLRGVRGW